MKYLVEIARKEKINIKQLWLNSLAPVIFVDALKEKGISDLTGLEYFTSLNHLELSGNSLTKDSNLAAIANLPLNYLDLSTNKLEDIFKEQFPNYTTKDFYYLELGAAGIMLLSFKTIKVESNLILYLLLGTKFLIIFI